MFSGKEYRVSGISTEDASLRYKLVSLGLIPGAMVQVLYTLCFRRYFVIQVQQQVVGLRLSEWSGLSLHMIKND